MTEYTFYQNIRTPAHEDLEHQTAFQISPFQIYQAQVNIVHPVTLDTLTLLDRQEML
jgi:hypothetical protein